MKLVSKYFGEPDFPDLKANVFFDYDEERPVVEFWKGESLVERRWVTDHSLRYAEDMAENYVMGILKLGT